MLATVLLAGVGRLRRAAEGLAQAMLLVAGWSFILCALFVTVDVVGRSVFGVSSAATVEITGYTLAFGIAWALAGTLGQRAHIRVDALINRLPLGWRQYLHFVALLLLVVFVLFCAWRAIGLVEESILFSATDNSVLRIPLVWPQALWAAGIVVLAILAVLMLAEVALLLLARRGAEVDAMLGPRTIDDEAEEALEAVAMARRTTADPS